MRTIDSSPPHARGSTYTSVGGSRAEHRRATDGTRAHARNRSESRPRASAYDFEATNVAKIVAECSRPRFGSNFGRGLESHRWHDGGSARLRSLAFSAFDSGIRLRRRENAAIAAGPHHRRATDGPRSHTRNSRITAPRPSGKVELRRTQP